LNLFFLKKISWATLDSFSSALIGLFSILLLSRSLGVSQFGELSYIQSFIIIINLVVGLGVGDSIIQRKLLSDSQKDSIFTFSLLQGIFGAAVCFSLFFVIDINTKAIFYLIVVEGVGCFFTYFISLHVALLTKDIETKILAIRTFFGRVIFIVTLTILLYFDFGLWAFVYSRLLQIPFETFFIWKYNTRNYKLNFDFRIIREFFNFGLPVMFEGVLWQFSSRILMLLVGNFHGMNTLGYLSLAIRFSETFSNLVISIIGKVFFPLFSNNIENKILLKKIMRNGTSFIVIIAINIICYTNLFCGMIVEIVFGKEWLNSVIYIQVLLFLTTITFSRIFFSLNLKSNGKTKELFFVSFCSALTIFVVFILTVNLGPQGVLYAWIARIFISVPLSFYFVKNILGYSYYFQSIPFMIVIVFTFLFCLYATFLGFDLSGDVNNSLNFWIFLPLPMQFIAALIYKRYLIYETDY
tara:strand:+ start:226 stop:1629 length:1404 start_codon:yes stop_codon:yes gene_type:complete